MLAIDDRIDTDADSDTDADGGRGYYETEAALATGRQVAAEVVAWRRQN